ADHERGVAAGAHDGVGVVGGHGQEREGAFEPGADPGHGLGQVAVDRVLAPQEVGGDLGVGLGGEPDAVGLELAAQLPEVLDDAVVDERDASVGGDVGVGVAVGGHAVGRPAGVPDAAGGVGAL